MTINRYHPGSYLVAIRVAPKRATVRLFDLAREVVREPDPFTRAPGPVTGLRCFFSSPFSLLFLSYECHSAKNTGSLLRASEKVRVQSSDSSAREDFVRAGVSLGPLALSSCRSLTVDEAVCSGNHKLSRLPKFTTLVPALPSLRFSRIVIHVIVRIFSSSVLFALGNLRTPAPTLEATSLIFFFTKAPILVIAVDYHFL